MAYADKTDGSRIILEGLGPVKLALSEAVKVGDLLGLSSGTWKLADGNNTIYAEFVAGVAGASGDEIVAYSSALVRHGDSGGAKGDLLYLSDTAGGTSASTGTVGQVVGQVVAVVASTSTDYLLAPKYSSAVGGQLVPGAVKLFFRSSGLYVQSNAAGKLTISADGTGTDDITLDGTVTVNDNMTLASGKNIVSASEMVIHDDPIGFKNTQTALTATATVTAAQLLTGVLDGTPTAAATYTLPTAALLVAGITGAKVGTTFDFVVNNKSAGANTITVASGAGGTDDGTMTVAQDAIRLFRVIITNVTAASEAYFTYGIV